MSCMSASTPGAGLHLTPQHTRRVATTHTRISSFTLLVASVSPVGMVTLLTPSQAALAGPPHVNGSVGCVWVCAGPTGVAPNLRAKGPGHRATPHARFTLLIIFFSYCQPLFSISIIVYWRKMHKTSETIQQYVWVNDFQHARVQKMHCVRMQIDSQGGYITIERAAICFIPAFTSEL